MKVQRPSVADVVNRDTQAMLSLAGFVQRRTSIGLRTDVVTLVGEFTDAVNAELDFTSEGQAGERIRNDRGARLMGTIGRSRLPGFNLVELIMVLDAVRLMLFPTMMAFAASSDLLTMTISNRVSIILIAGR